MTEPVQQESLSEIIESFGDDFLNDINEEIIEEVSKPEIEDQNSNKTDKAEEKVEKENKLKSKNESKENSKEEIKEAKKEEKEDVENEEDSEQEAKEEPPEIVELKEKIERSEHRFNKLMRKYKELEEKAKATEEYANKLKGEGINAEIAIEIAVAKKHKQYGKVFELLGLDPDKIVEHWGQAVGWTKDQQEEVKDLMKKQKLEAEAQELAKQKAQIVRQEFTLKAENIIRKYSEKLPLASALEEESVNMMIDKLRDMALNKDPRIRDCKTPEEAFKVIAVLTEKELYKKYSKAYDAISKIRSKYKPQETVVKEKSTNQKDAPKKEIVSQEKKQSKTIKTGANGGEAVKSARPMTEREKLMAAVADLEF